MGRDDAVRAGTGMWLTWVGWFLLGSCLGSFLNVCIYRLPREQSVAKPGRSFCPSCRHPIAWYDNIPLISYLALQARCRACHRPISWRYPVVEGLTGLATVGVVARFGTGPVGWIYVAFVCALIAISFIDLEFQIIPDEISLGGLVVGVCLSVLVPALHGTDGRLAALGSSLIGLLVGGGSLYVTGVLGDFVFRKESMGGGDIKLLAMAGTFLGWKLVLLTFFIAPVFALIPGLIVLFMKRTNVVPYGPFLSLGLVVSMCFGSRLIEASGVGETVGLLWMYYGPQWSGIGSP